MKRPRSGWQWNLLRRLPDWALKMRIVFLKNILSRKQSMEDEISDCKELLDSRARQRQTEGIYIRLFHERYPKGPVWPIKDDKRTHPQSAITDKTVVISKEEMEKSYKEFEERIKGIRKDTQM